MPRLLFLLLVSFIATACTVPHHVNTEISEEEDVDRSCSYFYFLWGTHAEYHEYYAEALEAYEKALICDSRASYIKEKLPLLLLNMGEVDKAMQWLQKEIRQNPENNAYRFILANIYYQQKRIADAQLLYEKALEFDPGNEIIGIRLAILHAQLEEYEKAINILQVQLAKNDSYPSRITLARILKDNQQDQEAFEQYEKALQLNWSKEIAYELGFFYTEKKDFQAALRIYSKITETDPQDETAALSRIQTLLSTEKYDQALESLESIRKSSNSPDRIDFIISKVLLQQKKIAEAKQLLLRLADNTDNTEVYYMLALLLYQEDNYQQSLSQIEKIPASSDEFEDSVYLQTRIYSKLNATEKAISKLTGYINTEESRSPLFYAMLSSLYMEQNQDSAALEIMARGIRDYPENHQLCFEYGILLERYKLHDEALQMMEKVLSLQPDHPEALNFIGYTWADRNSNLDQALEYIQKALKQRPDNGFIVDSLGWVYFRLGQYELAATTLLHSLELEPDDPNIWDHLGDVYTALHLYRQAVEAYSKAADLFGDAEKNRELLQKINEINVLLQDDN